jgi:hypothetical protein
MVMETTCKWLLVVPGSKKTESQCSPEQATYNLFDNAWQLSVDRIAQPMVSIPPEPAIAVIEDVRLGAGSKTASCLSHSSPSPEGETSDMIASIHRVIGKDNSKGYIFKCRAPKCNGVTCSSMGNFKRHDKAVHAKPSKLWCPVSACGRSETAGNNGFPESRKDKLRDHVLKVHPEVEYNA